MSIPLSCFQIVFEGQPFTEGSLKMMLRNADRVSVVEGATNREAQHLGNGIRITGSPDSQDGTREILREYQAKHPRQLYVRFANGRFWRSKSQMVQAAVESCLHGALMQVDVDEMWMDWQFKLLRQLAATTDYSDFEFFTRHFWASPTWHVALSNGLWGGGDPWRRLWNWTGQPVESHEPPRFRMRWEHVMPKEETRVLGLVFWHMSYSLFKNVQRKEAFYSLKRGELTDPMIEWRRKGFPTSGPPGPMVKYQGPYPPDCPVIDDWPI